MRPISPKPRPRSKNDPNEPKEPKELKSSSAPVIIIIILLLIIFSAALYYFAVYKPIKESEPAKQEIEMEVYEGITIHRFKTHMHDKIIFEYTINDCKFITRGTQGEPLVHLPNCPNH